MLENLCLSTVNNEDLIYCTKVILSFRFKVLLFPVCTFMNDDVCVYIYIYLEMNFKSSIFLS